MPFLLFSSSRCYLHFTRCSSYVLLHKNKKALKNLVHSVHIYKWLHLVVINNVIITRKYVLLRAEGEFLLWLIEAVHFLINTRITRPPCCVNGLQFCLMLKSFMVTCLWWTEATKMLSCRASFSHGKGEICHNRHDCAAVTWWSNGQVEAEAHPRELRA